MNNVEQNEIVFSKHKSLGLYNTLMTIYCFNIIILDCKVVIMWRTKSNSMYCTTSGFFCEKEFQLKIFIDKCKKITN